jgi:predicted nucleotidyltransferase
MRCIDRLFAARMQVCLVLQSWLNSTSNPEGESLMRKRCYTEAMDEDKLKEALARIAEEYGIRLAVLFGSSVTGRLHHGSDIDIAILLKSPQIGFAEFGRLRRELQRAAGDCEIDLAFLNRADPFFLKKITESCVLLFGEESELHRLKILSFRRYQDHRPYLRFEREYLKRLAVRNGA